MACNYPESVLVELDERCFKIPDLTALKVSDSPGAADALKELSSFLGSQEGEDYQAYALGIYRYLEREYSALEPLEDGCIPTQTYKTLVVKTDSLPRRFLYDMCKAGAPFSLDDLQAKADSNREYKKRGAPDIELASVLRWLSMWDEKFAGGAQTIPELCLARYDEDSGMFHPL